MTGSNPYSYLYGPFVALVVISLLMLALHWTSRRGSSVVERRPRVGGAHEYGVLVPVATPESYIEGEQLRRLLEEHRVRASLVTTTDGPRVMVFPDDEERARDVLSRRPRE